MCRVGCYTLDTQLLTHSLLFLFDYHNDKATNSPVLQHLCAQILYALRILRAHGMDDTDLQTVY